MQLHPVNVGYDSLQDRILLRFSTSEQVEYRLWITRRMLKGFWPGLLQLMGNTPMARQQQAPDGLKDPSVDVQRFMRELVEKVVQSDSERHVLLTARGAVLSVQLYTAVMTEATRSLWTLDCGLPVTTSVPVLER